MQLAFYASALLMGLAGAPHCLAMCGALCGAVAGRGVGAPTAPTAPAVGTEVVLWPAQRLRAAAERPLALHAGRIASYAAGGALAAGAVGQLAAWAEHGAVLRQLWLLLHAAVFAWALVLLVAGRHPQWVQRAGGLLARRLRGVTAHAGGVFATGLLWVSLPCGLLYSALMLASLSGGPAQGALSMALFGLGTSVSLGLAPWLWRRLSARASQGRQLWAARLSGLMLALLSGSALWHGLSHQIALWCATL